MTDKKLAKRFSIPPEKKYIYDFLEDMSKDRSRNMSFFICDLIDRHLNNENNESAIMEKLNSIEKQISVLNSNTSDLRGVIVETKLDTQNTEQGLTDDDINDLMTF